MNLQKPRTFVKSVFHEVTISNCIAKPRLDGRKQSRHRHRYVYSSAYAISPQRFVFHISTRNTEKKAKKGIWQKAGRSARARNTEFDLFVFYAHILIIGPNRSWCYGRGMRQRRASAQTRPFITNLQFYQNLFGCFWNVKKWYVKRCFVVYGLEEKNNYHYDYWRTLFFS